MFCDQVKVRLIAGSGGDGCKSFRREAGVPYGGPDGGDGGKGGSIIIMADSNVNTLSEYNGKKTCMATSGERGYGQQMAGKAGVDSILKVPLGTMIFTSDHKELIADLPKKGDSYLAAKGGRGGKGNANFATSTRQCPAFAELGEKGQNVELFFELRLVAEVGIIGIPSVGKSTLISVISDAKPKIADYPFTTLIPNLGVVKLKNYLNRSDETMVVADIPGLIEGASEGKGLGHDFLRHVSRSATLVHMLDPFSDDIIKDYKIINKELEKYNPKLAEKEQIVVVNKIDAIPEENLKNLQVLFKKNKFKNIHFISAATQKNVKELVIDMWKQVTKYKKNEKENEENFPEENTYKIFRPHLEGNPKKFTVEKIGRDKVTGLITFKVKCVRYEQIVAMTNFAFEDAIGRVYDVMEKLGITKELIRIGAKRGDIIKIGDKEIEFLE